MRGRRNVGWSIAFLFALFFSAACADSTMPEPSAGNASPPHVEGTGPSSDYLLPPIVVTVPGGCDPWLDINWCQGGGSGGGQCMTDIGFGYGGGLARSSCPIGDGGGGGGGPGAVGTPAPPPGSTPSPLNDGICTAAENGTVCESEDRPECRRRPDASGECVTRHPNPTEWAELGRKIDLMTEDTEYCREAKAIAQEMYAAGRTGGRIVLWDGRNYKPGTNQQEMVWGKNSSDSRGRIIEMDSFLALDVHSLLAHEALHAYLNSINWPGTVKEQEIWVSARETECAG